MCFPVPNQTHQEKVPKGLRTVLCDDLSLAGSTPGKEQLLVICNMPRMKLHFWIFYSALQPSREGQEEEMKLKLIDRKLNFSSRNAFTHYLTFITNFVTFKLTSFMANVPISC